MLIEHCEENTWEFGMQKAITASRDLLASSAFFGNNEGSNTFIKTFLPDPEIVTNLKMEAFMPQIELKEDTENFQQGVPPAGIGQAFATYNIQAFIHAFNYKNSEEAREFCRNAVTNFIATYTRYSNGNPPGTWWHSVVGQPEYLMTKITEEFWGLSARIPVEIQYIVNIDDIRGC